MSYDSSLPVEFNCPQCKKRGRLRGGEAERQTPKEFLPGYLCFRCPACQTVIKAPTAKGRWQSGARGQKIVFVLRDTDYA